MTTPQRDPRLLGHWVCERSREIQVNLWEIGRQNLVGVVLVNAELTEAVEGSNLDNLLEYLVATYGAGSLIAAARSQSTAEDPRNPPSHVDSDPPTHGELPARRRREWPGQP